MSSPLLSDPSKNTRCHFLICRFGRREKLYGDLKGAEVPVEDWADDSPLQLAQAAPECRHRERSNFPFLAVRLEVFETEHDIREPRNGAPVLLRREIDNPRRSKSSIEIRLPRPELVGLALLHVVDEHLGKAFLELKGDPLAHDSHRVYGVHESLGI